MQIKMRVKEIGRKSWTDSFSPLYSKKFEFILMTVILLLLLMLSLYVEYLLQSRQLGGVSVGTLCAMFVAVFITVKMKLTRKSLMFWPLYLLLLTLFGFAYLLFYTSLPIAFISFFADSSIFVFIAIIISPFVFVEMYRYSQDTKISEGKIDSSKRLIKFSFLSQGFNLLCTLSLWLLLVGGLADAIFREQSNDEMVAVWIFFAWVIPSFISFIFILMGMLIATRGIKKSFRLVITFTFATIAFIATCIIFFSFSFSVFAKLIGWQ